MPLSLPFFLLPFFRGGAVSVILMQQRQLQEEEEEARTETRLFFSLLLGRKRRRLQITTDPPPGPEGPEGRKFGAMCSERRRPIWSHCSSSSQLLQQKELRRGKKEASPGRELMSALGRRRRRRGKIAVQPRNTIVASAMRANNYALDIAVSIPCPECSIMRVAVCSILEGVSRNLQVLQKE